MCPPSADGRPNFGLALGRSPFGLNKAKRRDLSREQSGERLQGREGLLRGPYSRKRVVLDVRVRLEAETGDHLALLGDGERAFGHLALAQLQAQRTLDDLE